MLSLARIQLDVLSMHYTPTNIRQEAQKVSISKTGRADLQTVSAFAAEAKMKKIDMAVDFSESFEGLGVTHVLTDHVRLGQIITNLVSNAIRFTANSTTRRIVVSYDLSVVPPEDGTCEVPADYGQAGDLAPGTPIWLFVSVKDTGPGLTEHERNILFQRFTRESNSTLGLALTNRGKQDDTLAIWRFRLRAVHLPKCINCYAR